MMFNTACMIVSGVCLPLAAVVARQSTHLTTEKSWVQKPRFGAPLCSFILPYFPSSVDCNSSDRPRGGEISFDVKAVSKQSQLNGIFIIN